MNFKTTLVLLVLVAAGATLFYIEPKVPSLFQSAPPADHGTRAVLEKLKPDDLTRIEIHHGDQTLVLARETKNRDWSMPGNWQTRAAEVNALVEALGGLRSQFEAIPITADTDLAPYGLDQPRATVTLAMPYETYEFALGEAPATDRNQFARPTYLRLLRGTNIKEPPNEIVRLAPGLLALLDRPTDYYLQRRLFPSERIAKEADPNAKVSKLVAANVSIVKPKTGGPALDVGLGALASALMRDQRVSLTRTDKTWELSAPQRDRLDPAAADALLAAIPELWAERFVEVDLPSVAAALAGNETFASRMTGLGWLAMTALDYDKEKHEEPPPWLLAKAGLAGPEVRQIIVTRTNGEQMTLLIGGVAGTGAKPRPRQPPGFPPMEPEESGGEEMRYAKVANNPRVFLIKSAVLKDVFVTPDTLRDARLARFNPSEVRELEIAQPDGETLHFVKSKDKDIWKLVSPLKADADATKVNELLTRLSALEARGDRIVAADEANPAAQGFDKPATIKVTWETEKKDAEGDAKKTTKSTTLKLGKSVNNKLLVKVDDWPRVNVVDDGSATNPNPPPPVSRPALYAAVPLAHFMALDNGLTAQAARPGRDYRSTRLFEFAAGDVDKIEIQHNGRTLILQQYKGEWTIAAPFDARADAAKAAALANQLSQLVALKYEGDEVKSDQVDAQFGVGKSASLVATVTFQDPKRPPRTLRLGKQREGTQEFFGKLDDGDSVFAVNGEFVAAVDKPALELIDPALLRLEPGKIERLTKSGTVALALEGKGDDWLVFDAPGGPFRADRGAVQETLFLCENLRAQRFADYGQDVDWTKYGLDKPGVVVTVKGKDAKDHTIELGSFVKDERGPRYARVDRGAGTAVLEEQTAAVLAWSSLEYVNRDVLQFAANDVTRIQRKMGQDTLELTRTGDGWEIVKPAKNKAEESAVKNLVALLANLRAVRVAAFPTEDWKTYGLDDAAATVVTISMKQDARPPEHIVKIGKAADPGAAGDGPGGGRYAVVGDSKAVIVLPEFVSSRLTAAPITFRDRSLAHFADADKLQLERGSRKAVFARVDGSWKMTEPLTADADNDELDDFLGKLASLRADELVAEKPTAEELKKYGLDKPEATWKLMAGGQDVLNLVIGGPGKDGKHYGQLAGSDIVFLLSLDLSKRSLAEYRTRAVWPAPLDPTQVTSIRYGYAKDPFVLKKTETGEWQVEGKPDIKPNRLTVAETLQALARLQVSRYAVDKGADYKKFGLEPPDLVLELTTPAGKQTLQLSAPEGESKLRYGRIPEASRSDVFVFEEAALAKILRDPAAFAKAPERPQPPPIPPPAP